MNTIEDQHKSTELQNILFDLASSPEIATNRETLLDIYVKLESFYCYPDSRESYRHLYSDIFSTLIALHKDPKNGDIQTLVQNLRYIRENYRPERFYKDKSLIDVSESIRKLYDHVSLEIARLDYYDVHRDMSELSEQVLQVESEIKQALKEQKKLESKAEQFEEKLADTQKEYISILGIFSAVVLAFVGGSMFSSSVLESMGSTNIYRVIFITDFLAFVVVNLVYLLVSFIMKINEMPKNEKVQMSKKVKKCLNHTVKRVQTIETEKVQSFFPIKVFQGICLVVAILDILAWAVDLGQLVNYIAGNFPWNQ